LKNRNRAKSLLAGLLAVLTVLTMLAGTVPTAQAKSSSELKKQLEELKAEKKEQDAALKELKGQLKENVSEMEDVVGQKDIIDQEIFYINEQISNIEQQVATYSLLIADKQDELDNAQNRLQLLNEKNKERIQAMEEEGALSYWSVLFKANSFSDLLDRLNMIQEIAAADQRRIRELKQAAEDVSAARESLQGEKAELELAMTELEAATVELEDKRKEADALLEKLIAKGEAFEALIDESEDLQAELMQQIAKTEKDYKNQKYKEWLATSVPPTTKKPSSSNNNDGAPAPSSTGWRSPLVKSSYVTSPFGMRLHPVYKVYKMHHGVDLQSKKGDTIVAAKGGVVTVASYQRGGAGYYVTINHGDGFSSSYMHMTHFVVKKGDYVKAGQTIGYVGSTGVSTGPHLHFSIYYNGNSVNPAKYVNFK